MKRGISVSGTNNANIRSKKLTFENNAPFRSCISKISNTFTDNAEDLDIAMPMYNLLECSDNYSKTSEGLYSYYRNEIKDSVNEIIDANNYRINNNKTTTRKSFEYKKKTVGRTSSDNNILDAEAIVPLKYLSNFWRSLDLPLTDWKIELNLSCSRYCIISEMSRTLAVPINLPVLAVEETQTSGATFQVNNAKVLFSIC